MVEIFRYSEEPQSTWIAAVEAVKAAIVIVAKISIVAIVSTPRVRSSAALVLINTSWTKKINQGRLLLISIHRTVLVNNNNLTGINSPVVEARVTGAGEGCVGGPANLIDTPGVGSTVGGGGRRVGEALVDIPALPVCSLPHTPVGGQTVLVSLAPVLVVAASGSIL